MFMRSSARNSSAATNSMSSSQHDFEFFGFQSNSADSKSSSVQTEASNDAEFFNSDSAFELDQLIQLFAMCDSDNDDYVTRADFVRVSHEIGGLPQSLVCQLDRVLPANQSGHRVSLHELVTMARNFAVSSPVKLKRCEQYADGHHNNQQNEQRQHKLASNDNIQQQARKVENMPEINNPAITRLQREKEALEAKLGGMLQIQRQYGGGCEEEIANLQALISKFHQQIYVAIELQKSQRQRKPPVAPKPPPRRSLPSMHKPGINPAAPVLRTVQSQSRVVTAPVVANANMSGLEQIEELPHAENVADDSDSTSTSSSSDGESGEERRNRRHLKHSKRHRHSSGRRSRSNLSQPQPPQPEAEVLSVQTVPANVHDEQMKYQGFALDIEAVDNAFQQQEQVVSHLKQQLVACMSDRDRYKKMAQDFYRKLQYQKSENDMSCSPTTGLIEGRLSCQLPATPSSSRMAEIRQLPRISSASPMLSGDSEVPVNVTAADISVNQGSLSTPVAEHLVEETEHSAVIQELVQSLAASGCRIPAEKLQEFAAELETRSVKADRLRAAADLLASSLAKQRQHASNLAAALARSEENQSALRMALDCALQKAEAVQALLKLSESEQLLLLAHCRAVGVVSCSDDQNVPFDQEQQTVLLGQAVSSRRQAELSAQRLLSRLDNSCGISGHNSGTSSAVCGELGLLSSSASNASPRATGTCSSTSSRTTDPASQPEEAASTGVGSTTSSWTSLDEQRLREYAAQLDRDVQAMQMTINDPVLESAACAAASGTVQSGQSAINASMMDSPLPSSSVGTNRSGSTKDSLFGNQQIETAVLVQELATLKEQRAESRTQCFILDREKRALETELRARDQQVTVLRVQLEQAKLELEEASGKVRKLEEILAQQSRGDSAKTDLASNPNAQFELEQALQREKRLRLRIQELVNTLEMVGQSAEKQLCDGGVDLISELRKANSTLSESYERARKKQEQRIKRLEAQLGASTSRYETKISLLKKQVALLEETGISSSHFAPEAHL